MISSTDLLNLPIPALNILAHSKHIVTDDKLDYDAFITQLKKRVSEDPIKWDGCLMTNFYLIKEADL